MTAICYIWAADQTEPGMSGTTYTATNTSAAPAPIQPTRVPTAKNLVYPESLHGDWRLLGTAKGRTYRNDYGCFVDTPDSGPVEVEEIVRLGWYSQPKASTIHFELPAGKKAAYVKAAQAQDKKLVQWITDTLDAASK